MSKSELSEKPFRNWNTRVKILDGKVEDGQEGHIKRDESSLGEDQR